MLFALARGGSLPANVEGNGFTAIDGLAEQGIKKGE
jgi:hypothetical protein